MGQAAFDAVHVGDDLPPLVTEPISRLTLALYATGSGDHNPLHLDLDYVHAQGIKDVFAHGMLGMGYLGRMLTNWVPQTAIRSFDTRFIAQTWIGERLNCRGKVVEKSDHGGQRQVRVELAAVNDAGEVKHRAEATIAFT